MMRKLLAGGVLALGITIAPFGRSSWACEPPANPPLLVTFEGVALSSEGDFANPWTFRVDPPVEGLPETVVVFIERAETDARTAACQVVGPELVVGATYEIVGGQWPGNEHLNVSLYVGSYQLLSEAPAVSRAPIVGTTELPVVEAVEPNAGSSEGGNTSALLLFAAIGGLVVAVAGVVFPRSRRD